jgi:ElaB/YqjD/DUF883 family membrane-anchored ribosome-binding protein
MNTADTIRAQSRKDPEQLEHEIDRQRDHIGELVQALEGKLSPGELLSSVMRHSKDGGGEFVSNLTQTVKANPVPTLLAAAGLAWLASAQRHPQASTTTAHTGAATGATSGTGTGSDLRERVSGKVSGAKAHMGHARERIGEGAHGAMDSVRSGAQRANDGFHHMLEDNPMAVGAIGIAVGAMLGSLLPATRKENELMGGTRDRLADKARETVQKGFDKASEAGREVTAPSAGSDGGSQSQAGSMASRDSTPSAGTTGPAAGTTGAGSHSASPGRAH